MADESGISWTDATFNPWIGCAKVSPACAHCYAETLAVNRMGLRDEKAVWGEGANRRVTADATWRNPLRWAKLARQGLLPNRKENLDGHRPRVFCASMADVFEDRDELEEPRIRLFELIEETPELDWLVLTKRPEFARMWLPSWWSVLRDDPLPNLWLGVSIENARFTWRADVLREIPAAVRFISAEPLLGSLFPPSAASLPCPTGVACSGCRYCETARERAAKRPPLDLTAIDWVIIGGESGGRSSRPMRVEWARELRDVCLNHGIALHFKQWGSHDADGVYRGSGPKSAGKMLDGVEYCEFPSLAVPA